MMERDGVINVHRGDLYKLDEWEWTPGAPEALYELQYAGY